MAHGLDLGPTTVRAAHDTDRGMEIDTAPLVAGELEANKTDGQSLRADEPASETNGDALEAAIKSALTLESTADQLCYAIPDPAGTNDAAAERYRSAIETVTADHDISVTAIDRGFAVIYDQLSTDKFTGLGLCLGQRTTTVSLAYYGVPALSFAVPMGSEWVLEQATAECGATREAVAETLETFTLDPETTGEIEQALAQAYDSVIAAVLEALLERADDGTVQESVSVPIAVGGAGTINGLEYLIGGRFDAAPLPFSIRGVRFAETPAESAVRGAATAAADGVDGTIEWDDSETATPSASDGNSSTPEEIETTLSFEETPDADPAAHAIDQLFDRLGDRDAELEALRGDLDAIEDSHLATLEQLTEQTADIESQLEETAASTASDAALSALEADVDSVADEVETLTAEIEAIDSRLETHRETHEVRVAAVDDRLDETATAAELGTLEDELDPLEHRVDEHSEKFERHGTRLEGVSGRLEELTTRIDAVADADDELEALEATCAKLEDNLAALEARVDDQRAEQTDLREQVNTLSETVEQVPDDGTLVTADSLEKRLEETVETLEGDIETYAADLEGQSTALEAQSERLEGQSEQLESHADQLESESQRLETHTDRLETHTDRLDTLEGRDEDVSALATQVDTTATKVDDVNTTLEGLETRIDSLADHQPSVDSVAALEERVAELEDVHAAWPAPHEMATRRTVETLEAELDGVQSRVSELDAARDDDGDDHTPIVSQRALLGRSIAAGGGSAGVVAGLIAILSGSGMVGAGALVAGAVVLTGAVATAQT